MDKFSLKGGFNASGMVIDFSENSLSEQILLIEPEDYISDIALLPLRQSSGRQIYTTPEQAISSLLLYQRNNEVQRHRNIQVGDACSLKPETREHSVGDSCGGAG